MKRIKGIIFIVTIMLVLTIIGTISSLFSPKEITVTHVDIPKDRPTPYECAIEVPSIIPVDLSRKYIVSADVLRIREEANTEPRILGKLINGSEIKPEYKLANGWYIIKYNGKDAYVSGDFIKVLNPEEAKQVVTSSYLVVINSKYNTLNIYKDGNLFESYACATGKKSTPSPEGNFQIVCKFVNPSWKGKVAGGAANNSLGKRWMGLSVPGTTGSSYGIHGNSDESSIGKNVSGGCIRMHNADVEHVYEILPIGTEVIISSADDVDENIAASYGFVIN